MADIKIADLNLGTVLGAGDALVLVQGDTTLQISGENVALGVKAIADLADKAYVDAIVAGAPEMLDTLNELAAAIGDDPNFSSSIRTILDSKLPTANFGLEFWNALSGVTTYHIAEDTNLYFTTARARQSISAGAGISYNNSTGVISSTITQYTNALARGAISAGAGISYNNSTGVISSSIVNSDGEIVIANGNGHGGAGYAGVLTLINTSNGATNINKFIRLNNNGNFEIINSAYSASIFTVTDSGQTQLGTGGLRFSDGSVMTTAGALGSTPTFTSVTTGLLNVQNVTFTGTGAVNITSGNDLNLTAAGDIFFNSERTISLTRLKTVVAASTDFADFKSRIAAL